MVGGLERAWVVLPRAMLGGPGETPATIDVVLLHPARGVALLEAPPHWTPAAPALLMRRLARARFDAIFPGHLPVVHLRLPYGTLSELPQLLAEEFEAQPPLDLPGGDAWMLAVRRALLASPGTAGAASTGRRSGVAVGLGGLVLASALVGAVLVLRPQTLPGVAATSPGALERLAAEVVTPAAAVAAKLRGADASALPAVLHLGDAGRKGPPPAEPAPHAEEDAAPAEFAEAVMLPATPSPPTVPPAVAVSPGAPPLPAAPPEPPAVAVPSGLVPYLVPPLTTQPGRGPDGRAAAPVQPPGPVSVTATPAAPTAPQTHEGLPPQPPGKAVATAAPATPAPKHDALPAPAASLPAAPQATAAQPTGDALATALPTTSAAPSAHDVPAATGSLPVAPVPPTNQALAGPAVTAAPRATPSAAAARPADPAVFANLLRRGDTLLAVGDVSGARRFYERAAEAGSAEGARAAGRTYDPAVLATLGVRGIQPDPEAAKAWYRRADALAGQEAGR